MLIYHPAFDIYHAVFRMLRLLEVLSENQSTEVDRLRILDFYLLFPALLRNVQFPAGNTKAKQYFASLKNPYERIEDPKALFTRLGPYQRAALDALAARGLIDAEMLSGDTVKRTNVAIPIELRQTILLKNGESKEIQLLTGPLYNIDLYGRSGLKARSDLFEYRYDAN